MVSATPPLTYKLEVLGTDIVSAVANSTGIEILISSGVVTSLVPASYPLIEVATYPPVGGGFDRVEVLPYTKQGPLTTTSGGSEFPISGGTFTLDSIAARVSIAPTGSSIILDVLKNNVSIFTVPGNRPTIAAGSQNATVGSFGTVMFASGDYVEVIIVQVGSSSPGDTLVASLRLVRTG